jgi:hypothetical protein
MIHQPNGPWFWPATRACPSDRLHASRDGADPQQRAEVIRIAGQHQVGRDDQECYMRVDHVGRTPRPP